jgi:hypothetical protein
MEYRFKTEEEFLKTFGKDWMDKINAGWHLKMNVFFGIPLKELDFQYYDDTSYEIIGELEESWSVSKDMLVVIKCGINLKQPKTNR